MSLKICLQTIIDDNKIINKTPISDRFFSWKVLGHQLVRTDVQRKTRVETVGRETERKGQNTVHE